MLRTRSKNVATILAALGITVALSSGATAASADTVPSPDESASGFIWTADPSPAGIAAAQARTMNNSVADTPTADAALAPETWAGCGIGVDPNKVVRTYTSPRISTKVLKCGNDNYGYFHIKAGHASQFETLAAMTGQNWRDVADIGMDKALRDWQVSKERAENDTTCYSAIIYYANVQTGETITTKIVRIVTGNRSNNVVTAFPSDEYCKGDE